MLHQSVDRYLAELAEALMALDRSAVVEVATRLMRARRERRQIFLFGNGGSAALASHMATDLNKIIIPGQARFRAIALVDNGPLTSAIANDMNYEDVFSEQLRNLCQPGDVVVAVSCSGNSPNVLKGLATARELGATTIGFTGDRGGNLKHKVDLCVQSPIEAIEPQEDIHVSLDHVITVTVRAWMRAVAERMACPTKALVLAAGEGTRLRPLTLDGPKPMVPINGKPLLEHTLKWLRRHNIRDVAINLHHSPTAITNHFGTGEALGLRLAYSYEPLLLGTAGAVRNLETFLSDGTFVVVYGDVLTDVDLAALLAFHHENVVRDPRAGVTMALKQVANPTEGGLVGMDNMGRITRLVEKPTATDVFTNLANAGVLVMEPNVIRHIPDDRVFDIGEHLLPRLLAADIAMYGWVVPAQSFVLDIGTFDTYRQAQSDWAFRYGRDGWQDRVSSSIATA